MGCDIHIYVEKREGDQWRSADEWADEYGEGADVPYRKRFYDGRNYDLFAILANVRNGRGFAGVKTGDGFNPISEPRGLPEDVSQEVRAASDRWDSDGHSHSYLTVAEIMAFDWTQTTRKSGWVNALTFHKWVRWARGRGEGPAGWSGFVAGGNVEHVSADEMERRIKSITDGAHFEEQEARIKAQLGNLYCEVEWAIPYYEAGGKLLGETLPRLWRLGDPSEVRLVFWFDN